MKNIWLSVDWDFFQEEKPEWDWSHAETPIFQEIAWVTRGFYLGEDIRAQTSPEKHFPVASGFWDLFRGESAVQNIGLSDSHSAALPYFWNLSKTEELPDELWNFDAHHDLGYCNLYTLRKWAKEERAEAGSWLFVLLKLLPKLRARIVYPSWKDTGSEPKHWTAEKKVSRRVSISRAPSFDFDQDIRVTGLFIAKSSAWSPPWNDEYFQTFVDQALDRFGYEVSVYGDGNPTDSREYDLAAASRMEEHRRSFLTGQVSSKDVLRSEFSSKEEK